ncbi:MAG TPA: hypothetical protein PKM41_12650 [Deltaproteobacteria bacterium]|jgi:hypothetical protein|nr:hypothetical protein [Deltaproteobacteria bacterium]HOI06324.1 hypothetical protein [Deltaproteobacteria bacterium]
MIYIEYMEHDRSIPAEMLSYRKGEPPWPEAAPESGDRPVAVLGRALSLGPQPPYLAIWRCHALEKLDQWDSFFKARHNLHSKASREAIHLSHAGCYEEVHTGPPIGEGIQYIEYFNFTMGREKASIAELYSKRAELYRHGTLNLVLCRMGPLGPDPGGLAIWTFPGHGDMEEIIVDDRWQKEVDIVRAGIYRKLGEEAL